MTSDDVQQRAVIDWLEPKGEPVASVIQVGRWEHRVMVTHDWWTVDVRYLLGRRRAQNYAKRKLARYKRDFERKARWKREAEEIK